MSESILITKQELSELLSAAVSSALSKLGIAPDEISQREAYRRFGEGWVKRHRQSGNISRIKVGENNAKATYSLSELQALKISESMNHKHITK